MRLELTWTSESELTNRMIWCDLEEVSFRLVSPTCLWAVGIRTTNGRVSCVKASNIHTYYGSIHTWTRSKISAGDFAWRAEVFLPSQILITSRRWLTPRTTSSFNLSTTVPFCESEPSGKIHRTKQTTQSFATQRPEEVTNRTSETAELSDKKNQMLQCLPLCHQAT
jgi:hypothetical protein